jgi:hypothetical protein
MTRVYFSVIPGRERKRANPESILRSITVMPGFMPGIHIFAALQQASRGWPGQARP